MHVLISYPGYKPAYRMGGPVLVVSSLAEELVRRGHRVTVVATNANLDEDLDVPVNEPVNVDGVEVWYCRRFEFVKHWFPYVPYFAKSNGYFYAPRMTAALNRVMPSVDVVHVQSPFSYTNVAAARAAFQFGRPLIYQQHGILDPQRLRFRSLKKRIYLEAIEKPIMRRAAALIALTDAEEDSYRALGVTVPCYRIGNGIEISQYRTNPSKRSYPGWRVGEGALVVLFMGRLHPMKGPQQLLAAFRRISERFPDAVLVIAGPDECGLVAGWRQEIEREGLSKRIFFPGMVLGEEKLDLLARADLFCLPSEAEGFSMAVLEALASGTGVLLSPGCRFPDVERAHAGRIVPAQPEAIAAALGEMLAGRAELGEMGRHGRALVGDRYSWREVADAMLAVYAESVKRGERAKVAGE